MTLMDQFDTTDPAGQAALEQAVADARQAADEGRLVPHERVRKWLLDLARGIQSPRPRCE